MIQRHDFYHVLRALRWVLLRVLLFSAFIAGAALVAWAVVNLLMLIAVIVVVALLGFFFIVAWDSTRLR